jgi:hypothetical protein
VCTYILSVYFYQALLVMHNSTATFSYTELVQNFLLKFLVCAMHGATLEHLLQISVANVSRLSFK